MSMSRIEASEAVPAEAPPPPATKPGRSALPWLAVLGLMASAVLGSNMFSVRDRVFGSATPDAAAPVASRDIGGGAGAATGDAVAAAPTSLRSSPWWQDVTVLEGNGAATSATFTIAPGALQWRVRWTCTTGRLVVRAPRSAKAVVDGACPQGSEGYSVQKGPVAVEVTAEGPWRLQVAQQVDLPLVEPPTPAMTGPGSAIVAGGPIYDIDKTGVGKATLYRQADGRYAVRLEDFFVSPNVDLELRLSSLEAPHSSSEFANAPSEVVAVMDVTAGSVNYAVPPNIDPARYKSVVVWCVPIKSAYAAAVLGPVR